MSFPEVVNLLKELLEAKFLSEAGIMALMATIVAVLIPIAILVIEPKQGKFPLDRNIIFKKIFMYRDFIALIIPISISYLFPHIRLISAIATIYLAIVGMVVFTKIARWLSSKDDAFGGETEKQKLRIQFLNELNDENEIIDAWATILNSDYGNMNQNGLLDAFLYTSKKIKNGHNGWNGERYWGLLRRNFEKVKEEDIDVTRKLIKATLTYYQKRGKDGTSRRPEALRQISIMLMTKAATSNDNSIDSYIYFNEVECFLRNIKEEELSSFLEIYLYDLFSCFLEKDVNVYDKWRGEFFDRLVVTEENIHEAVPSIVLDVYLRAVLIKYVGRPDNPPNEIGSRLSEVTEQIFKRIDPIIWFRAITFLIWPHEHSENREINARNRVAGWCERTRNYGLFGRLDSSVFVLSDGSAADRRTQIREHIKNEANILAENTYLLLSKIFNTKDLDYDLYGSVIKNLKRAHKDDSDYIEKLEILESTLERLKEKS